MLVLSRKQREQIRIGDQVTITILRIKGNTVRVGIEAPPEVHIVRSELGPEQKPKQLQSNESGADNPDSLSEARRQLILAIRQNLAGAVS